MQPKQNKMFQERMLSSGNLQECKMINLCTMRTEGGGGEMWGYWNTRSDSRCLGLMELVWKSRW